MAEDYETTDVLICGCGPTGAMLSGYLAKYGIPNIVLEREADITTDPRGIALDEDGIRLVQGLGLHRHLFTDIGCWMNKIHFVGGVHHDLYKRPFMSLDTSSTAGITGHVSFLAHKQPMLETYLRSKIGAGTPSELRSGCTLTSIRDTDEWVYATYTDSQQIEHTIRSKFLVGADGKTGFTRKQHLEPLGVQLLWAEKTKYQETWVALNWKMTLPTPETHPSFPLWELGYTPQEVFDLFFPEEFRFLCNPTRPAVCGRFGPKQDRLWRFEFVVAHDEDDLEMAMPHKIDEVVVPYITHPGKLYGLSEDVRFPSDCIEVLRCRPFRFSARSCDKWSLGRVIICGDAAHVFPPFGGQGIASGFRDAISLSWRLAVACRARCDNLNVEQTLQSWYGERKQQLEASLATTVRNGDMVNSSNAIKIFIRDWGLWLLQMIPSIKRWIELGPRQDGRMSYEHANGMPFMSELGGGVLFSQGYCTPLTGGNELKRPQVLFTDDVIFGGEKDGLFQLVVLLDGEKGQLDSARADLNGLDKICHLLRPDEASFFVRRSGTHRNALAGIETELQGLYRTASAEEFDDSVLSQGLPKVRGYKEYDMWEAAGHRKFVILRSDRFVFAACNSRIELERAAKHLQELFPK